MRYDYNTSYRYSVNDNTAPKREPLKKAEIKKLPVRRKAQHKKSAAKTFLFRFAAITALIFSVSFCIYSRVEISDVKTDIINAEKQIDVLNSQGTALEMQLENKISYSKLEDAAIKLGMVKRTKSKTHYIDTSKSDRAEILSDK